MALCVSVRMHADQPALFFNNKPHGGIMWFGRPNAAGDFAAAGVHDCTFILSATEAWWIGPQRYDFQSFDRLVDEFVRANPKIRLMPRIHLGYTDLSWWAQRHARELSAGRDQRNRPADYMAAANNDIGCPFSFASQRFLHDASQALTALVQHCERRDNGNRFFGYHLAGGISNEWFEWWTYVDGHAADYSAPATQAFRLWLARKYGDSDAALRKAWRMPRVTCAAAPIPPPRTLGLPRTGAGGEKPIVRRQSAEMLRSLRDPTVEQPAIDYYQFLGEAAAVMIDGLCGAIKRACDGRKVVGVFHGYAFPHWNNLSPARQAHSGFRRVLASHNIDFVVAPYHYDHRGINGVHGSQTLPQAIHAAGKLFVDEIDTFTHLTRWPWNSLQTMRHATTPMQSAAMVARDAAYVRASAGGAWWMDLLHQRWHADPKIIQAISMARRQAQRRLQAKSRRRMCQIALFVDDVSALYTRPGSDLAYHLLTAQRQFELTRLGVPFDELLLSDILRRDLPDYRLCIFPNAFHMDDTIRRAATRYVRRQGRWSIWFHAPGVFGATASGEDRHAAGMNLAAATELLGMPLAASLRPGRLRVTLIAGALERHGIRVGSAVPRDYGMPLSAERQRETVVYPHPLGWQDRASPVMHVAPAPGVIPLGLLTGSRRIGLAMHRKPTYTTVYSSAPCMPAALVRGVAACAGAAR